MSDEKKEKKEDGFVELMAKEGLEKIQTPEELAKAYKELQSSYSSRKPGKNSSQEELLLKTAEFYGGSHDGKTDLPGELGEVSSSLIKDLKLHKTLADAATAKIAGHISNNILNRNKAQVTEFLSDSAKKAAVDAALSKAGKVKEFQGRYNKGLATVQEVELWASNTSKSLPENKDGIAPPETDKVSQADAADKIRQIYRDIQHPYHHAHLKGHVEAKKEMAQLEKRVANS